MVEKVLVHRKVCYTWIYYWTIAVTGGICVVSSGPLAARKVAGLQANTRKISLSSMDQACPLIISRKLFTLICFTYQSVFTRFISNGKPLYLAKVVHGSRLAFGGWRKTLSNPSEWQLRFAVLCEGLGIWTKSLMLGFWWTTRIQISITKVFFF